MVRAKGRYLHFTQWSSKIHTWKTKMKLYIIKDLFPVHCQTVLSQFHVLPEDGTRIRNQEFRGKFGVTRRRARCSVVAEIADFSYIPHIHITKPLFVHKSHHLQPISTLKHMYKAHISYYKSWVHLHTHVKCLDYMQKCTRACTHYCEWTREEGSANKQWNELGGETSAEPGITFLSFKQEFDSVSSVWLLASE